MAIALQDGIFVWQKVAKALAGANPGVSQSFKELKTYIATQLGNPQLQFVPFTAEQITTNLGYSPDVDGNTVYAVYAKGRRTSGTTSSFFALHAATDNSATTTTITTARFKATGQVFAAVYPTGLACETELTVSAATAVGGATESSAADAADGFVVVGA
jgi:hypothetical protein